MRNGTYVDEAIIQLRKTYEKNQCDYDITVDKLWIREKYIQFVPYFIFDQRVNILIPENFIVMPERIAKVRYVNQHRPPVILTSMNYSENIGFHLLDKSDYESNALLKQMEEAILLHSPETVIYDRGEFISGELEGRWFEYKNFTVNDETYHLQFLLCSKKTMLVGGFNCRMKFYDEWKLPILKSLEHITIQ